METLEPKEDFPLYCHIWTVSSLDKDTTRFDPASKQQAKAEAEQPDHWKIAVGTSVQVSAVIVWQLC